MTTKRAHVAVFYFAMVLGSIGTTTGSSEVVRAGARVDSPAGLFRQRIDAYTRLRQGIINTLVEDGIDPNAEDNGRQFRNRLGLAIREARHRAQPGEIFCPEVAGRMRQMVWNALRGQDDLLSEVPEVPAVRVNDFYPEGEPLATVPTSLLQQLDLLPPELQYRFLGSALILLDVETALIVDVIPDAFERSS